MSSENIIVKKYFEDRNLREEKVLRKRKCCERNLNAFQNIFFSDNLILSQSSETFKVRNVRILIRLHIRLWPFHHSI